MVRVYAYLYIRIILSLLRKQKYFGRSHLYKTNVFRFHFRQPPSRILNGVILIYGNKILQYNKYCTEYVLYLFLVVCLVLYLSTLILECNNFYVLLLNYKNYSNTTTNVILSIIIAIKYLIISTIITAPFQDNITKFIIFINQLNKINVKFLILKQSITWYITYYITILLY